MKTAATPHSVQEALVFSRDVRMRAAVVVLALFESAPGGNRHATEEAANSTTTTTLFRKGIATERDVHTMTGITRRF